MKQMNVTTVLDGDEIQKYMDEYAQQIIKTEIAKHVRMQWEHWANQHDFKQLIKKALTDRLQAHLDEVLLDYEGIKQRATDQIHRSLTARVTKSLKRLEEA